MRQRGGATSGGRLADLGGGYSQWQHVQKRVPSVRTKISVRGGLARAAPGPGGLPAECDASTVDDCRNERAPCFRERDQILTFEIRLYGPTYELRVVASQNLPTLVVVVVGRCTFLVRQKEKEIPRSRRTGYCPLGRRC